MRVQTKEEEYLEVIRRINHLMRRPDGMTRTEIIRETRMLTRVALREVAPHSQ